MKTKEELNAIKEEVEALSKKLAELSEEELAQVVGGVAGLSGAPKKKGDNPYSDYFEIKDTTKQYDIHFYK